MLTSSRLLLAMIDDDIPRAESSSSSENDEANGTFRTLRIDNIQDIPNNVTSNESLQAAARYFDDYCSGLLNGSLSASEFVLQSKKVMSMNHISRDIDFYGHTIKDGDGSQPLIVRPPVDDLIFFRNIHNSKLPIQGVFGAAEAEKFYNHSDWEQCPATIHLQGTSVPEHIMNGEACAEIQSSNKSRRVPDSFDFSKYTTVLDVIYIVELGNNSDLPALDWSSKERKNKLWNSKDNDNFLNLMKIYIYIHDHKQELNVNSKVERTRWRSTVTGYSVEYLTVANEKYSGSSLCMHYHINL